VLDCAPTAESLRFVSILGFAYGALRDSALSSESTTRAWQLRDHASDRERFFIDLPYYRQAGGDLEKALQTLELWARPILMLRTARPPTH
jgi:hypothetical protein